MGNNALTKQLVHTLPRKLTAAMVLNLAIKKYSKSHLGINFTDLEQLGCKKKIAQNILKRMCVETQDKNRQKDNHLLFRSPIRSCPQTHYPASVEADVNEYLKMKKVLIDPTEVTNFSNNTILPMLKAKIIQCHTEHLEIKFPRRGRTIHFVYTIAS